MEHEEARSMVINKCIEAVKGCLEEGTAELHKPARCACPVCGGTLESRGGYIRVIIGKRDMTSEVQGASWYCAECDRAWDYGDLPSIARQLDALAGTDAADRLRWLLAQAERVITVDDADRQAVDRACKLLREIDNGFDRERG